MGGDYFASLTAGMHSLELRAKTISGSACGWCTSSVPSYFCQRGQRITPFCISKVPQPTRGSSRLFVAHVSNLWSREAFYTDCRGCENDVCIIRQRLRPQSNSRFLILFRRDTVVRSMPDVDTVELNARADGGNWRIYSARLGSLHYVW